MIKVLIAEHLFFCGKGDILYHYLDMHCDTLMTGFFDKAHDVYDLPGKMNDVKRMHEAQTLGQFFAIFFPPRPEDLPADAPKRPSIPDDDTYFSICRQCLVNTLEEHADILASAHNAQEIQNNFKAGKQSAILTIEDGRAVRGDMARLQHFYDCGVRAMALTWNFANCFGFPNSKDPDVMNAGLTEFGKEAIGVMNEMGMLIDVSHLSDGGFYDVAKLTKKPFVATHSNCRALSPHTRNLTDDMIRLLAEKGGVSGINFGASFLDADTTSQNSRVSRLADHIEHFIQVGGEDCVGLGTDFDGIGGHLEIAQPTDMYQLFDELQRRGLSSRQIDKVASGNVLRVIHDSMK